MNQPASFVNKWNHRFGKCVYHPATANDDQLIPMAVVFPSGRVPRNSF